MAMFEVDADSGFSISERKKRMKMPVGMVDEVKWPEISKDQKRIQNNETDRQTPSIPENGFKLNLAIRYDSLFAAKFPGTEEKRYTYCCFT